MSQTPHKWLIVFTPTGVRQLRDLPSTYRMAVFRVLRGLLKSDNPLAAHGVKKLKALRGKSLYRNRVSDYRILFSIDSTPVTQLETEYQGTLTVEAIRHRSRAYRP